MLFDLNAQTALAAGFGYYKTREAEFRALFTGVSDDVLGAWFSELADHYPTFRTRNTRGSGEAPMLVVTPQDERVTQTVLGDFDTRDDQGAGRRLVSDPRDDRGSDHGALARYGARVSRAHESVDRDRASIAPSRRISLSS